MKDSKHTPGPWTYTKGQGLYEQRYVIDSEPGRALAVCAGFEPRNEANARLIAAAPAMYDALVAIVSELENFGFINSQDNDPDGHESPSIAKALEAIAKATGQR